MNLIIYILRASCCISVLYLFYFIFLRKDTAYQFNRIILLFIVAISWIIPSLTIIFKSTLGYSGQNLFNFILPSVTITSTAKNINTLFFSATASFSKIVIGIYVLGTALFIIISFIKIAGIYYIIKKGTEKKRIDGIKIITTEKKISPFSWINYFVLSENDYNNKEEIFFLHEKEHIKRKHSLDILFVELSTAFQWFNPFIWLLGKSMRDIHEFQADNRVLTEGIEKKDINYY